MVRVSRLVLSVAALAALGTSASADPRGNLGGGLIEFLVTGNSGRAAPQQSYAPQPAYAPRPQPQRMSYAAPAYAAPAHTGSVETLPDLPDAQYQPTQRQPYGGGFAPAGGQAPAPMPQVHGFDPRFERQVVDYAGGHRAGTIVIDTPNRYLYLVQDGGKAIRYGITVGEDALAFSGIAKVGNMAEWPKWTPTKDIHKRIEGLPASVPGGVDNPLGARALYLYQGGRDTMFRIHGTNQPEYIGASISSGCIRMTNEDVIDLYSRVKMGTIVVVLDPKQGDSPYNSKMALQGSSVNPIMQ